MGKAWPGGRAKADQASGEQGCFKLWGGPRDVPARSAQEQGGRLEYQNARELSGPLRTGTVRGPLSLMPPYPAKTASLLGLR
jgi:hypothetical protein